MMMRIWKKNGETMEVTINTKEDMARLELLAQKFGWELDVIGRRPW